MPDQTRTIWHALVDLACSLVSKVVPWLLAIWLVVEVRNTALALAGEDTFLGAAVELAANLRVTRGFAFIFGAFGIFYGFKQRTLRLASEKHLRTRLSELQNRTGGLQ